MTEPSIIDQSEVERRRIALAGRFAAVQQRMADAGGADVAILAVSKGHPVEAALAAQQLGIGQLGENYAQDLLAKAIVLDQHHAGMDWHFIGQLQTNKVRLIAEHVAVWQSVDRLKVGREIAKRASGARVFAQANLSSEPQKGGCSFEMLPELVEQLVDLGLRVEGLMGVGTADNDLETAAGFRRLRRAADDLGLAQCSMGMTADLELAIHEGSTMVRIGSDLFGPRL